MKIFLSFFLILSSLHFLDAQCTFNPVVSPSALSLCPNTSDTLWSTSADSYLWYKNNNPILGATSPFLVVSQIQDAGASFLVVATIAGCSEPSPSVLVSDADLPALELSIADSLNANACLGESRNLTLNDPYNINIRWFRNGVQLNGQTNDTLNVIQSGTYSCLAFADNCPSYSQTSASLEINFNIAQNPIIDFNSNTLELSTTTSAAAYVWYINGELISDSNSNTFLPQANGEVTVEVIFNEGCSRISPAYTYTEFVANCDHTPNVSPDNLVLCPNSSDTLFTQVGDSYRWFRDGIEIQGENSDFLVVSSVEAGSQFSVETTTAGCSETSEEVLVDGWIFLPLTVSTQGNLDPLCEGDALILEVLPPFTENIQWLFNGNPVQFGNELTLEITESGTYAVNASTDICPAYFETSLNLEYVFQARPQPVITYFPVSNTLSADVEASSYVWMLNEEVISGANTQIITPSAEGNYTVTATYSNGCSNISEAYFYNPVGFEDVLGADILMYPNPAGHQLWITTSEPSSIQIFDMSGRLVLDRYYSGTGYIAISSLETGPYLLVMKNETRSILKRQFIMKE
ncbi:MAG: T9SS type A sorting domain-containing protein [Bacteroidia bacterium]